MTAHTDLLDDIFEDERPALYLEFEQWLSDSRRFRAFATTYRAKIRAKRVKARDDASLQDLRAELETTVLLLQDERFTLQYEAYAASKQRGPDFTVAFRTHIPFNVEVRRMRSFGATDLADTVVVEKLMAVLFDKLGQMPPSIANLLWLHAEGGIAEADLVAATVALIRRAEQKDEHFFTSHGFASVAAFARQFHRLSGIMLRQPGAGVLWLNPIARHQIPPPIATALRRLTLGDNVFLNRQDAKTPRRT